MVRIRFLFYQKENKNCSLIKTLFYSFFKRLPEWHEKQTEILTNGMNVLEKLVILSFQWKDYNPNKGIHFKICIFM